MRVTDDDLRAAAVRPAGARASCPSSETLASAAAGGLEGPDREALLEHLGGCQDCAEELRLLAPFGPWADAAAARLQDGRPVRDRARPWWSRPPVWAAAALVVLGLPLLLLHREPGRAALRSQAGPAIHSLLPESTPQSRARCVLRWSDMGEGARYAARVLSKDLRPLAGAEGLDRPEYAVPPDALKTVPSGGEIVW